MSPAESGWFSEADLPLAKEDRTVEVEVAGVMVQRKIIAGTRVPPDLIEAYEAGSAPAEPAPSVEEAAAPDDAPATRGAKRR